MSGGINSSLTDTIAQSDPTTAYTTTTLLPTTLISKATTLISKTATLISKTTLSPPTTTQYSPTTTLLVTTTPVYNSTTTNTTNHFDPQSVADAWEKNKATVAWLIPVVIVVVILLVMLSLALVYTIRGVELWVLKCCHRNCCFGRPARRLETEYTHLTAALHEDHDSVTLTGVDGGQSDTWGGTTDKRD